MSGTLRDISLRSPDPLRLADFFERVLGFTKLRYDEQRENATVTDGYLHVAIYKSKGQSGDDASIATIDHIGFSVDDVDVASAAAEAEDCPQTARSTPATRFHAGPDGWSFEMRNAGWGWDDVIQTTTQLYGLAPVPQRPDTASLVVASVHDDEAWLAGTVDQFPPGSSARIEMGEGAVLLMNVDGDYYAVQDRCPHNPQAGRLSEGQRQGAVVECPIHRSRFDVVNGGAVLEPPARRDVAAFDVAVRGNEVWIGATSKRG